MIDRLQIGERVREWGLREDVVEKDYVIGWVLWAIGSDPDLSTSWVFKGGTCLKKCYMETYRFSEDLDFTVLSEFDLSEESVGLALARIAERAHEASGINFAVRPPLIKMSPAFKYAEARLYYSGPRNAPPASVKVDLLGRETVVRPTVLRPIGHAYPDKWGDAGTVRCYSFEEVFAEKIRAMGERCRPRDLYDIINLFRRNDLRDHPQLVKETLIAKCAAKGIPVPTLASLEASPFRAELVSEWESMLAHQLPALPSFEVFWNELPALFNWLSGESTEVLPPMSFKEELDMEWVPPPTVWTWGFGVPIESIRFAASNRLLVALGYQGSVRNVEPYSLRRTKAGNILLGAVKAETGQTRTYRLDRIESVRVTPQPFRARFPVEIGGSGPVSVPPLLRTATRVRRASGGRRRKRN